MRGLWRANDASPFWEVVKACWGRCLGHAQANHIAQCNGDRFVLAGQLAQPLTDAVNGTSPWVPFAGQDELWSNHGLVQLAPPWPQLAAGGTSIADATIKDVAEFYAEAGFKVEILTGDAALRAYTPTVPVARPRRRGGR